MERGRFGIRGGGSMLQLSCLRPCRRQMHLPFEPQGTADLRMLNYWAARPVLLVQKQSYLLKKKEQ